MVGYTCQLEIPSGFRLLDAKAPYSSRKMPVSWNPTDVAVRNIIVAGQPYLQYTLKYDVSIQKDCPSALLPVKYEKSRMEEKASFRFRRLINDNVTELTSALDVKILPPLNGRRMEKFFYMQYDHQFGRSVSDELAAELVRQGAAAGMDEWIGGIKNPAVVQEYLRRNPVGFVKAISEGIHRHETQVSRDLLD